MNAIPSLVSALRQAAPADIARLIDRAIIVRAADVAALVARRYPADGCIGPVPTLAPYARPLLVCWTDQPTGADEQTSGMSAAVLLESLDLWSCDPAARMDWRTRARGAEDEALAAAAFDRTGGPLVRWLRRARIYLADAEGTPTGAWQVTLAVAADGLLARATIDEGPLGREKDLHPSMTAGMQDSVQDAMRLYTRIALWVEALTQCANVALVKHGRGVENPATYDLAADGWSPGIARGSFARDAGNALVWRRHDDEPPILTAGLTAGAQDRRGASTLPDAFDIK